MNEGALGVLIVDDEAPARSILREHLANKLVLVIEALDSSMSSDRGAA